MSFVYFCASLVFFAFAKRLENPARPWLLRAIAGVSIFWSGLTLLVQYISFENSNFESAEIARSINELTYGSNYRKSQRTATPTINARLSISGINYAEFCVINTSEVPIDFRANQYKYSDYVADKPIGVMIDFIPVSPGYTKCTNIISFKKNPPKMGKIKIEYRNVFYKENPQLNLFKSKLIEYYFNEESQEFVIKIDH